MVKNPYIGQHIVCINDDNSEAPLKKGLVYIIKDIHICPTCGMLEFSFDIPMQWNNITLTCVTCETKFEKHLSKFYWSESWRFVELETIKNEYLRVKLETRKIVEELDVICN